MNHKDFSPIKASPIVIEHHGKILFKLMKQWKNAKKIPPVLLLLGPSGIGKKTMAHFLGQWILCQRVSLELSGNALMPCMECPSCKKIQAGYYLDFIEILPSMSPSKDELEKSLKISQFRKLKESSHFGAYEGLYKIILIPHAQQMTLNASHSMLKFLEEPPPHWIFILTCEAINLLLPTLISRCQKISLAPFSFTQLEAFLASLEKPAERIPLCAKLAEGSLERALEFISEEIWEKKHLFFQLFNDPKNAVFELLEWISEKKQNLEIFLNFLEQTLRECILWSASQSSTECFNFTQSDGKPQLISHVHNGLKHFKNDFELQAFWILQFEHIAKARMKLKSPVNQKIIAQDILLPWLQIS